MLAAQRRSAIISLIRERKSVTVEELAQQFHVSEMTIRRDLAVCEGGSEISRCHGGAMLKSDLVHEAEYEKKLASNLKAKQRLAAYCAGLVPAHSSVYLDADTTTLCIAEALLAVPGLTIVTNDLKIGLALTPYQGEVIVLGGRVQKSTGSMLGPMTQESLQGIRVNMAFVGAASIGEQYDAFTPTQEKVFLKRVLHSVAEQCYLVADQSKFHSQALYKIDHLSQYTGVITDAAFTEGEQKRLALRGIRMITVA